MHMLVVAVLVANKGHPYPLSHQSEWWRETLLCLAPEDQPVLRRPRSQEDQIATSRCRLCTVVLARRDQYSVVIKQHHQQQGSRYSSNLLHAPFVPRFVVPRTNCV